MFLQMLGGFSAFYPGIFSYGLLCSHAIPLCLLNHALCGFVTFLTFISISFPCLNGNVAIWMFVPSSALMELLPVNVLFSLVPASCLLLVAFKLCFKGCGIL